MPLCDYRDNRVEWDDGRSIERRNKLMYLHLHTHMHTHTHTRFKNMVEDHDHENEFQWFKLRTKFRFVVDSSFNILHQKAKV